MQQSSTHAVVSELEGNVDLFFFFPVVYETCNKNTRVLQTNVNVIKWPHRLPWRKGINMYVLGMKMNTTIFVDYFLWQWLCGLVT